ncbi:MAG: Hsp20/alpha crystallin family protein [Hyphomonadaceae bacterium]|nr:Hsp20/alpha crystallin family protein [Hyphomonadaceae bacterium]
MRDQSDNAPVARRSQTPAPLGRDPFWAFRSEMDRLFDDFFTPRRFDRMSGFPFTPALDITESDKAVRLRAELPGVDEKDLEINLDGDLLTIRGEKREERTEEKDQRRVVERGYGSFERSVRLPFAPNEKDVTADFKNGVLTITTPKPPEFAKQAKRIRIGEAR